MLRLVVMVVALAAGSLVLSAPRAQGADTPSWGEPDAPFEARLMAAGRALSEQFEQGDLGPIVARMTPALREAFGGAAGFAEMRERMLREDGPESGVIAEEARARGGQRVYRRIARRNVGNTPTLLEWTLDADDRIVDIVVRPQPIAVPSGKGNY